MYQVYLEGQHLYHPYKADRQLMSGTLTLELGKNGTFDCVIPPEHPLANAIDYRKSIIIVQRFAGGKNPATLYRGVAMADATEDNVCRELLTDGDMVFLCDTTIRPYTRTTTPVEEFKQLIAAHNAQADAFKQFTVGNVTVTGAAERRHQAGYQATREALDALADTYGGYFVSRTEGGKTYIDWLAELDHKSSQAVAYGSNIINISKQISAEDIITRLIPLGKSYDGVPTTIKTVNNNKDYIQDTDVVQQFGIIEKTMEWSDIESPSMLLTKAREYYKTVNGATLTVEVTAVDLADAGIDIEHLTVGDWVHCVASPYGIDTWMQITKIVLNLFDFADSRITLGASKQTYTQTQLRKLAENHISKDDVISAQQVEYYRSTSRTVLDGGEWSTGPPGWEDGAYIWQRTLLIYASGATAYTPSEDGVCITGNDGQQGADAVLLRIDSSNGNTFKNNMVSTVLSVTIFKGENRITGPRELRSVFGAGAYLEWGWKQMGEDNFHPISVEDSRLRLGGFQFVLSPDDVDTKVVVECNLIT